ncbi:carbohydrate ABC transporter permease [Vallitalea maricola]|uniref:Sugar ABC transporter permease n=1 Tax=Vallitalea maricola TaxID=3074433 RepID=A0ACB5UH56_9FIRM|nr:sugar ABC transporter permease [Vallitalea sp. AN17-2]
MQKYTAKKKKKKSDNENLAGYIFILPYVLMFIVFTGIPFVVSIILSFVNVKFINNLENVRFVGFDNYVRMFQDADTMEALFNTVKYSLIYVPLIMVLGFMLAVILNKGVFMKNSLRSMIFLPYVSNMVAVAVIFKLLLGAKGILGQFLMNMGLERPPLLDMGWALPTVAIIAVWKGVGLNMITYLAALQEVPGELLEAAEMDGANRWHKIKNVILPYVSPTSFFLLISSIITSLQNFTIIQSLTEGKPGRSTVVMSLNIVRSAFTKYETSYASAQAMLMFAIVMIITLIQWRGQKKWVNY